MPLFLFSSHARTIKIDFSGIKEIATIFRTSAMATAIRVVQKGERPAIVTLVEKNSVVWQVANPIVPKEFWVSGPPAKGTVAHRLLSGSCSDKMLSEDLPSYLWVNSKFGGDYRLVESSWMVTADEVLSLLWWEDEQQIIDYADREEEADDEDQHYSKRKRW